jgi:outer membrane protein with beta-barrel domain
VLAIIGSASAAAADGGIKFGPTFAKFSSDALDFKTRAGVHGGIFFGGNPSRILGLQGEINWIRKRTATELSNQAIRIDYLQVPVLLRLNAGTDSPSAFALYGIAGPAVDIKIGDELEGVTIDDGFEGADVSLVFGGGVEIARIIVEGRYEKGLRRINNNFFDSAEIKKQAFTILFGVRFN